MWTNRFSPCMCVVRVRACLLWFPFLAKEGRPSRRLGPALEALRVVSPCSNRNVEPPEGSMTYRHATRHNCNPIRTSGLLLQLLCAQVAMVGTIEVKLDYAQFDGTAGEPYRAWRRAVMNFLAQRTDESGSSGADHLLDIDMGGAGAGAPPMPGGAAGAKMVRLRLARAKLTYGSLVKRSAAGARRLEALRAL